MIRKIKRKRMPKSGGPRSVGLRCKAYQVGCIVCDTYRFLDTFGRFPRNFDEAHEWSMKWRQAEDPDFGAAASLSRSGE